MEKLTKYQATILASLDEAIDEINEKLKPAEKLIAERNRLLATRRALLSEKSATGGSGGGNHRPRLTMEEVIRAMEGNDSMSVSELAEATGYPDATVRSHLNRHKDARYEQDVEGNWALIGG